MRVRTMLAGLLQAGLAACGGSTPADLDTTHDRAKTMPEEQAAGEVARSMPGLAARAESPTASAAEVSAVSAARAGYDPASPMVVRTGNASLEVDSLETGLAALRRLAATVGGYVAGASIQGGRDQVRRATLELKVPSDRFDELTAGLEPIGKLEFANVAAEDVGEEYVDLAARAANSRRLEERLLDLLGTRTGRLQDVLSVERELARVREEIERIDGRLRYLKTRAAVSTLSVTLHEPPPIVGGSPGSHPLAQAFRQAWRNFVGVLAGSIASLGYLLPVAALAWGAIFVGRRLRKQPA